MADWDRRLSDSARWPVWRREPDTLTMANGGTTEVTTTEGIHGIIGTIAVVLPDSTNGVNATLTLTDENSVELYNSGALADNQTHLLTSCDVLAAGIITIGITASADPGADWIATVYMYGV